MTQTPTDDRLLQWLGQFASLPVMSDKERVRYHAAVDALLAAPYAPAAGARLLEVARAAQRIGDKLAGAALSDLVIEGSEDPHERLLAAVLGAMCRNVLGDTAGARERLRAAPVPSAGEARTEARALIENGLAFAAHLEGDVDQAERRYLASLELLSELPAVPAGVGVPRAQMVHARLNNLADLAIVRARRLTGGSRDMALRDARRRLEGALSARDCPPKPRAMMLVNVAVVMDEEGRSPEAIARFDELIEQFEHLPDHRWVLPVAYRNRARAKLHAGDARGARGDLHHAMLSSLTQASSMLEREAVEELCDVLALLYHDGSSGEGPEARALAGLRGEGQGLLDELLLLQERKDRYSPEGTSASVAGLAVGIMKALDGALPLDPAVLETGALLHDLGKLLVPWGVLNKPVALNPAENEALRAHCHLGTRLLNRLGLPDAARVADDHHRHFAGGAGYPDPRPQSDPHAMVVAVADVFHAMTVKHPAGPAPKRREEALAELRRCAGTQFHPGAVAALEKHLAGRPGA